MTDGRRAPGALAIVGAALFAPTVLFISAPNAIIFRNLLDIPYRWETAQRFLMLFAVASAVAVPVFAWADRNRLCAVCMRASMFLGVCVLLASGLSAFHGDIERPFGVLAGLDGAALVGAAFAVFRARRDTLLRVFGLIGAVLVCTGVGDHAFRVHQAARQEQMRKTRAAAVRAESALRAEARAGNVYHIILDAFQTEAYQYLAAQHPASHFPGFTQYTEFSAHYARTNHSVPNMLSGRFYRERESMWAWREEAFSGGLWAALANAGVGLHLYPHYPPYCTSLGETCEAAITLADSMQFTNATVSPANVTVDLWFLSLLPPSVRTILNAPFTVDPNVPRGGDEYYGFSLTGTLGADPTLTVKRRTDVPDYTHSGAYSILNFERLLADEPARPAYGQYVFYHAIVPHWPFVVDAECGYIGLSDAAPYDAYMAQAMCALRLVERLITELKRLDRYEDALIVVHADHGGKGAAVMLQVHPEQWPGPPYGDELEWLDGDRVDSAAWPHHLVDVYRRALLLVKTPGATEFATSDLPVQTIDLAPTIARHAGADASTFPGLPIEEIAGAGPREVSFFASSAIPDAHVPDRFSEYVLREGRWTLRRELHTAR